jgi:hypothetical protein
VSKKLDSRKKVERMMTKVRRLLKRAKSDVIEAERLVILCRSDLVDKRRETEK